ncbi:hypothetical protein PMAYCL1PPCAC_16367, partial [Pristionchus mayeri]
MCFICAFSFVAVVLASAPLFLSVQIRWLEETTKCNDEGNNLRMIPFIAESDLIYANDCLLLRLTYISSGILFNALPFILLICFSIGLITQLRAVILRIL